MAENNEYWYGSPEFYQAFADEIASKIDEFTKNIYDEAVNYTDKSVDNLSAKIDGLSERVDLIDADHYAFEYNANESDPTKNITYPGWSVNTNYKPASMNYTTNKFDYGDWKNVWFLRDLKVVMLNFDGTEAYEIDPDDYTKKKDSDDSVGEEGNVMIAIPKIYIKIEDHGNGKSTIHVSKRKLDDDYNCWAHHGLDGQEKDYCYMAAYNGYYDGSKLRSLSGYAPLASQNAQTEINYAVANNPSSDKKNWYTGVAADRFLIQILLLLIGKSTDTQTVFGYGFANANTEPLDTGTMNDKGLFWGEQTGKLGVKVFGIENFWGSIWNRIAGWISVNGVNKLKLTYGTEDGSSTTGYTLTGDGYVAPSEVPPFTDNQGTYLTRLIPTKYGLIPDATTATGTATTYVTDYMWRNNTITAYALVGGYWSIALTAGAFYVNLFNLASNTTPNLGASLSYKKGGEEE